MIDHVKLIFDFINSNNPLGKGISLEEIPRLLNNLCSRLNISNQFLDYSPASLKLLDTLIVNYYQKHLINMEELEVMQFIRELSAYFGNVLQINTDCKWVDNGDLWRTEIFYTSGFKINKEGKNQSLRSVTISLGSIAAAALDKMDIGKSPGLYTYYKNIASHKLKEKL
jgi:hypothetical protein